MATPPNAFEYSRQMDPADIVDFQIVLSQDGTATAFLEAGEAVASYTLTLTAEAVAAGLEIMTAGAYATSIAGNIIKFWLEVDSLSQGDPVFDGSGVALGIELTAVTNSSPARTKQRTFVVTVANQ